MSEPNATYALSGWLFLRLLGLIYLVAFVSLATQIRGLVGRYGIVPTVSLLNRQRGGGLARIFRTPTLCWINSSDNFLAALCWGGGFLAILLVAGLAPLPILIVLWLLYLSLFTVSGPFLGYQWDVLLLETGFLAVFLAPAQLFALYPPTVSPSPIIIWLLWWLLFRVMFSSGLTKILSGDRRWRDLSALAFHYETQPLPTRLAWRFHQLPLGFHRLTTAFALCVELVAPFLIFVPGHARIIAAALFLGLMILIQLTGNYAYLNLLVIVLCLTLFDDQTLSHIFGLTHLPPTIPTALSLCLSLIPAVFVLLLSPIPLFQLFRREFSWPEPLNKFIQFLAPFRLVNNYGLFSIMTIERPEIVVEASEDGENWRAYEFRYKPGNIKRAPAFVAPLQPRLDWQMWFAAMGYYHNHAWVGRLMMRLLEGEPLVEGLLEMDPFQPIRPRYVRCVLYDYRFTTAQERRETGAWWRRERRGIYAPDLERSRAV